MLLFWAVVGILTVLFVLGFIKTHSDSIEQLKDVLAQKKQDSSVIYQDERSAADENAAVQRQLLFPEAETSFSDKNTVSARSTKRDQLNNYDLFDDGFRPMKDGDKVGASTSSKSVCAVTADDLKRRLNVHSGKQPSLNEPHSRQKSRQSRDVTSADIARNLNFSRPIEIKPAKTTAPVKVISAEEIATNLQYTDIPQQHSLSFEPDIPTLPNTRIIPDDAFGIIKSEPLQRSYSDELLNKSQESDHSLIKNNQQYQRDIFNEDDDSWEGTLLKAQQKNRAREQVKSAPGQAALEKFAQSLKPSQKFTPTNNSAWAGMKSADELNTEAGLDESEPYQSVDEYWNESSEQQDEWNFKFPEEISPKSNHAPLAEKKTLKDTDYSDAFVYGKPFDFSQPLPDLSLLVPSELDADSRPDDDLILARAVTIEEKLAEFKVKVRVQDVESGPVVTRYEIEPDAGVRGNQVINLEKDLARALGCESIRIVETIPGKTCMGIELPNPKRQMIRLSAIVGDRIFCNSSSKLTLALGQDILGKPVITDLARAPHLLVAGTTGSGKSVGVNAMILSLLFKTTPEEVRLIMIDPKMLELSVYEGIPHLLAPVVTDMKLAANALTWCVNEMEKRYRLMSYLGVRNLAGFNNHLEKAHARGEFVANPFSLTPDDPERLEKLPYIVVVVDEFADLMMTVGKKIEELIARLAQKARAAGIHLILATQRPSVDVITGLIKANIPTRIAFQVSSKIDSRTILDQMGAENLLGHGDMLFLPPGSGYPQRVHGAFVADDEVHRVVEYLKQSGEPDYVDDILTAGVGADDLFSNSPDRASGEQDSLYDEVVAWMIQSQKISVSAIQRHFTIGYPRAARLMDQFEEAGIVSPQEANGKRTLLISNT